MKVLAQVHLAENIALPIRKLLLARIASLLRVTFAKSWLEVVQYIAWLPQHLSIARSSNAALYGTTPTEALQLSLAFGFCLLGQLQLPHFHVYPLVRASAFAATALQLVSPTLDIAEGV